MLVKSFSVPEKTKQIQIQLSLPIGILDSGPRYIELKEDFERRFDEVSGGPATIKVIKIGTPEDGMKTVIIQCDGIKAIINRPVFDCSK